MKIHWTKSKSPEEVKEILKKSGEKSSKTKKERFASGKVIPWNKNLTKETDTRIREYGKKQSVTRKGKHPTEETCEKYSKNMKKRWSDPEYRKKMEPSLKKWMKAGVEASMKSENRSGNHNPSYSFPKGNLPWNTGLTKETCETLAEIGRKNSEHLTGSHWPATRVPSNYNFTSKKKYTKPEKLFETLFEQKYNRKLDHNFFIKSKEGRHCYFDFYDKEMNTLYEIDGEVFHPLNENDFYIKGKFSKMRQRNYYKDIEKNKVAEDFGYNLIRIKSLEVENYFKETKNGICR